LVSAVLLALPPGWCQAVSAHCRAEQGAPAAGCCHQAEQRPADTGTTPVSSEIHCCCSRDAALVGESVQAPDDRGAAPPAILADLANLVALRPQVIGDYAARADLYAGPPLRILHCVWRR
jgi:hypothetical protein